MPQIGYLVHDLADAAVARRLAMFREGGATTGLAGFLRNDCPVPDCLDAPTETAPLLLGRTRDARLGARTVSVLRAGLLHLGRLDRAFAGAEVIVARNLEMLVIAAALRNRIERRRGYRPRLVYECLDIHRLLTAESPAARAVQRLERRLAAEVDHVLTSSPAFVENHLDAVFDAPVTLVENKVPIFGAGAVPAAPPTDPGPPWRIGWFGMLRCRRSFSLLAELARVSGGRVEVVLRGRPSPAEFPDFDSVVADAPGLRYDGPYEGAAGLAEAYRSVHFAWCIDFFEEGRNSAWLLPNRLYESAHHNTVPLALGTVETGRRLRELGAGIVVQDAGALGLALFERMTAAAYRDHLRRLSLQPPGTWAVDAEACRSLVRAVLAPSAPASRVASQGTQGS